MYNYNQQCFVPLSADSGPSPRELARSDRHVPGAVNALRRNSEVLLACLKLLRSLEPRIGAVSALEDKKCH